MLRSKLGLVGLCVAVVGLMGLVVASAQASSEWTILNSKGERKTATELPATLEGKIAGASVSFNIHTFSIKIRLTCTSASIIGMKLEKEGKLTSGSRIKLIGCRTFNAASGTELPGCRPKIGAFGFGEMESASLKGQLQTNGEIKIEPVTGATLFEFEFEPECTIPSPTSISGVLFLEEGEGELGVHLQEHLLRQGPGTSLNFASDTAEHLETSLGGSFWVFLGGAAHRGLKWGVEGLPVPLQPYKWLILNAEGERQSAFSLPAELAGKIRGESASLDTHLVKLHVKVTCTGSTVVGTKLEKEGKLTSGGKVEFTGCKTFNVATGTELPECGVKAGGGAVGKVITTGLKGQLQANGLIKIEPTTGTTFATLEFEAGCVLPSPTTVNGSLFLEDGESKGATYLVEHLLQPGPGTSLFVGADTTEHLETSLIGSGFAYLSGAHSGLKWSASEIVESSWLVLDPETEGKALESIKAALAGKIDGSEVTLLTHLLGVGVKVPCTSVELIGANLESTSTLTSGLKAKFTGCKMLNSETGKQIEECVAKTKGQAAGTVETNALKGQLVKGEKEGLVKVEAKEGTALMAIEGGEKCLLASSLSVNGTLLLKDGKGLLETNAIEHLLEEATGTELWVGTKTPEHLMTTLQGSGNASLSGERAKQAWGGMTAGTVAWLVVDANQLPTLLKNFKAALSAKAEAGGVSLLTHLASLSIKIGCTTAELVGASVESFGKVTSGFKAKFTSCELLNASSGKPIEECVAKSMGSPTGTVETSALKGELVKGGLLKVTPKEGTALATLASGEGCSLASEIPVNGTLNLGDGKGELLVHAAEHLAKQGSGTELWVGEKTAEHLETSIDGGILATFTGEYVGRSWGGMTE